MFVQRTSFGKIANENDSVSNILMNEWLVIRKRLLSGTDTANNSISAGTVPANNFILKIN